MEFIKGRVNWMKGYGNWPHFELLVEGVPPMDEMRYERRDSYYLAEKDGCVSFFSYSGPGSGYGGRGFEITLKDESKITLVGPWSGRATYANLLFPHCANVTCHDNAKQYEKNNGGGFSGAVTIEWLKAVLDRIDFGAYYQKKIWTAEGIKDAERISFEGAKLELIAINPFKDEREIMYLPAVRLYDGTLFTKEHS